MDAGHGVAIKLAFSSVRQDKNYRDDPHVQLQKEKKTKGETQINHWTRSIPSAHAFTSVIG